MTDLHKRSLLKVAALTAVAAAALVGCGKKEEPKPAEAAPPGAPPRRPAKPEPLKIAFAYVGPVGDGGWTFAHDNGRKASRRSSATRWSPASSRTCPSRPTPSA
jgi:basic membrane protein A